MLRYGRHTFILGRVFPWKGFGGKVSEGGMCWVTRIPLPLVTSLKKPWLQWVIHCPIGPIHGPGSPLPDGPGFPWAGRAWISIAQWAHPLPDGPGFPWGKWTHPRAWFSMGPWVGPLEQWAHPLNSCSTRLIVDRPIVTMGNPLYKGPESPRVSLTRIGI